jgi:hypothetical protein
MEQDVPAIGFDPCPIYGKAPFSACEDCQSRCLPLPYLMALAEQREVKEGYYSTTEILKPLRAIYLARHTDYYIDPIKATFMIMGTAIHKVFEDGGEFIAKKDEHLIEKSFSVEISPGFFLTGKYDYRDDRKALWDTKSSKSYPVRKHKGASLNRVSWASEDYFLQTNIYRAFGCPDAEFLKLFFLVQGWERFEYIPIPGEKGKFRRIPTSLSQIEIVDVPVAPIADVRLWVKNRLAKIREAEVTGEIPVCLKGDYLKYGESGIGLPNRCADYCNVRDNCTQAQELLKK